MTDGLGMPPGWDVAEVNRWLDYHSRVTRAMVNQRTSLESRLVPITAYVLIAAVECYRRHPEMVLRIADALPPEDIGRAGREPGNQVDAVHLWSQANIFLHGRQILILMGVIGPDHEPERCAIVFDFWRRAADSFRGDGRLQAWDADLTVRPYDDRILDRIRGSMVAVDDVPDAWTRMKRLNAALTSYLFLLYFDTRSGIGDTGPYEVGDGRVLLVRDFSKLGASDFPWSTVVGDAIGHTNLTAAFVLDGVRLHVNDWGTSITEPENYLDRVVSFGLYDSDTLEGVTPSDELLGAVKDARGRLYRHVAHMSRRERINAGAYVYFTFLRPFAEVAGVADELDWTVPRDSGDVYEWLEPYEGSGAPPEDAGPYYEPVPE